MFIGHFGVAMAAKRWAPQTSLPVLTLAAEFVDVVWPMLLIVNVEHVRIAAGITPVTPLDFYDYPWTHSLLMGLVWSAVFAGVYYAANKYKAGAIACGLLVVSHWFLDCVVHIPDLPLAPWSHVKYGLGLWNSRIVTAAAELPIFLVGVWLYASATRPKDKVGEFGWWSFVTFLLVMWLVNIQGNAPPGVIVLGWSALIGSLILLAWVWWVDKHRVVMSRE